MTCFLIAGEASGDMHAARLMESLKQRCPDIRFVGLGGDSMRAQGCALCVDYRDMAYMGVMAVLGHLPQIHRNFQTAKQALLQHRPDVLILIDYPSFNLKMAAFCRQHLPQTKIVYYIPPKVWIWKKWRIHTIARLCDLVLGILPFEPDYYAQHGYTCQYVGNPTADAVRRYHASHGAEDRRDIIAILPGSRPSEISHCLPIMLQAARRVARPTCQIHVAMAPGIDDAFYRPWLDGETLTRDTFALLTQAKAAIVNSGTATLEAALLRCPETAVYHIACSRWLQWLMEPILFRLPWFTLVNLIPRHTVIRELIAKRFTQVNVEAELTRLISDEVYTQNMLEQFEHIRDLLGTREASDNAADAIIAVV